MCGLPVLHPDVAVHVEAGEVILGHSAVLEVGLRGEVLLDALLRLMVEVAGSRQSGGT